MWLFGYGSLVWRPDFPHLERRPAYIRGWIRRFWQGSTDHRGVPGAPGRVVTLLPGTPDEICWGMAYALEADSVEAVVAHLDHRERGGYARWDVDIHLTGGGAPRAGVVYVATPENANYLGPADPDLVAAQIIRAHGPSGANVEYLIELATALRGMQADDPHVFDLERRVRALQTAPAAGGTSGACSGR